MMPVIFQNQYNIDGNIDRTLQYMYDNPILKNTLYYFTTTYNEVIGFPNSTYW